MTVKIVISLIAVAVSLALFLGSAGPVRKEAVPEALSGQAIVPGLADVRYRSDRDSEALIREGIQSIRLEQAYLTSLGYSGPAPLAEFLAVSGGGDNGAFGAGLLNGWTVAGNRPEFKLVTGVSTGALIAPFAFLGPAYDDRLKSFYTTVAPEDILKERSIFSVFTDDALADNKPLWNLVEKAFDQALLDAIAGEYEKGRLLLVATTDLDARKAVLWNMTKIAASRDPKALDLFRSVLIASAAVPGTFPPVMIDVEVDGHQYQEMHVDGGAMSQVFVYPASLRVKAILKKHNIKRQRSIFIIRNDRMDPDWAQVERRTISIAGRAISSLIHTQGIGDIYRIYVTTKRDGGDFNLAYIPESFNTPHTEEFDTAYMQALYRTGFEMAKNGYPWKKTPPGY